MFQLSRERENADYNNGHYDRYSGVAFDPQQSAQWRAGWNQANAELTRPDWL